MIKSMLKRVIIILATFSLLLTVSCNNVFGEPDGENSGNTVNAEDGGDNGENTANIDSGGDTSGTQTPALSTEGKQFPTEGKQLSTDDINALYRFIPQTCYLPVKFTYENRDNLNGWGLMRNFIDAAMTEFGIEHDYSDETDYRLEYLTDAPRVPKEDFIAFFHKIFGESYDPPENVHEWAYSYNFMLDESTDSYVFYCWSGDGGEISTVSLPYYKYVGYETAENELYIYVKFGVFAYPNFGGNLRDCYILGSYGDGGDYDLEAFVADYPDYAYAAENISFADFKFKEDPENIYSKLMNGEFDDLLPTYKHTFALAADGTYYWVSTEPAVE